MNILVNLTQHTLTREQFSHNGEDMVEITFKPYNGVSKGSTDYVKHLLNFTSLPTRDEIISRATALADYAEGLLRDLSGLDAKFYALIGGAPYLMSALEKELKEDGITPLYAFSKRESVEKVNPDGSITKTCIFKHAGYIEA